MTSTRHATNTADATSTAEDRAAPADERWSDLYREATTAAVRPLREVVSPDGAVVGQVPVCTAEDVLLAAARARVAQSAWARTPLRERCAVMRRFADLVLERETQLLDVVQAETGKSRMSGFEELGDVVLTTAYYVRTAAAHLRPRRRRGLIPVLTRTVEHRRPVGVVGVVTPWNYPLTLAASDAVPALLAGNAVVLKPDSRTPLTALLLLGLLREAGLPRDVMHVVTGAGTVLGPPLVEAVDHLMFTGSTATGRTLARQCADRLIGFSAELGGKNPMLVLDDADVGRAAEGAVQACFASSGQLCVSIERIYVADAVHDRFVAALVERVGRMRLGTGPGWDVEMGSLISAEQLATVQEHVADALAQGAHLLAGGHARPDLGPTFHEPTVLTGVTDDMALAREETFGPVVAVYRVTGDDEAVARANDTVYGLNASVWSRARGPAVAARLRAGTVNINEGYAATWGSHDAPIGGMGESGLGRRHGREGIVKYTESQTISTQRLIAVGPSPALHGERYVRLMTYGIRLLRRLP